MRRSSLSVGVAAPQLVRPASAEDGGDDDSVRPDSMDDGRATPFRLLLFWIAVLAIVQIVAFLLPEDSPCGAALCLFVDYA